MRNVDPFDAPVPGYGLTKPKGEAMYEQPPQYSTPNDAAEVLFDKLTKPKEVIKLKLLLKSGASAEEIARTILLQGFVDGKWSVDTALLLTRVLVTMIVTIGKKSGLKDSQIKFYKEDKKFNEFLSNFEDILEDVEEEKEDLPENIQEEVKAENKTLLESL